MQLEREVVLYTPFSDEQNAFRRLMLSNGLMRASHLSEKNSFGEGAIVPGERWESISSELYHKYFTLESPPDPGSWISIVQIPEEIMDCFRPLQRASAAHWKVEKINELFVDDYFQFQRGIKAVQHYCAHFNEQGICQPDNIGILVNPANLLTVTQNLERSDLIGLHLDSYDRNPLEKRHLSSNRICINLGSQERYFLFINLTLKYMKEKIEDSLLSDLPPKKWNLDLLPAFLHCFPTYSVTRIAIHPGEAYIAPTENIFHDGSTLGRTVPDIQLTARGNFQPHMVN